MELVVKLDATPELLKALNAIALLAPIRAPENKMATKATTAVSNKTAKKDAVVEAEVLADAIAEDFVDDTNAPAEVVWDDCVAALRAYRAAHGVEKARAMLNKFKAPTIQALQKEDWKKFVEVCK